MAQPPSKPDDLAARSGPWPARSAIPSVRHTGAVAADRFDILTWRDTYEQSAALRDLAAEFTARHASAADLLTDAFLAAYQARPHLRASAAMAPSRLLNHHIITALLDSAEFTELRRTTAGDPYAAAMAVLSQASTLRRILEQTRQAQEPAEHADKTLQETERTAAAVGDALEQAAEETDEDGTVPNAAAESVHRAIEAARRADAAAQQAARTATRSLTALVPGIRAAAQSAAARAASAARKEAALMRTWGVGPGQLQRMPFDHRKHLAERLAGSRLSQWADLIGRFRQMASGERARKVQSSTGELVGVTLGDDLSRVVPSELANLGLPELRAVFAARYAAAELMLYDTQGDQTTGRGAIIACVDTSHSMYEEGPNGITREAWAKACALALLDQARHAHRDFVGILFSAADKLQVFRFPADEPPDITRVLEFAETFLGGGTSYQRPLSAAAEVLQQEFNDTARSRGDIVMITDDDCGVTEQWMRHWKATKHQLGFRVFGVAVGASRVAEADSVLDALCDNLRSIEDLTDIHTAADLFRLV